MIPQIIRGLFNAPPSADAAELERRMAAPDPDPEAIYPAIIVERWRLFAKPGGQAARSDEWCAIRGLSHEALAADEPPRWLQRAALSYVRYLNLVY